MERIKNILVVEDQPVYRKGIVKILSRLEFVAQCDEAENGQVGLEKMENMVYNVVFLDISMPVMDGVTAAKIIREKYPKTSIVILSMIDSKKQIIELLELGVSGYLLKSADEEEIIKALQLIAEGRQYFTEEVYRIWADFLINKSYRHHVVTDESKLTDREIEIIILLCQQYSTIAIALKTKLSKNTIANHRASIMQKIGTDNIVGIVLYAIREGLFIP